LLRNRRAIDQRPYGRNGYCDGNCDCHFDNFILLLSARSVKFPSSLGVSEIPMSDPNSLVEPMGFEPTTFPVSPGRAH